MIELQNLTIGYRRSLGHPCHVVASGITASLGSGSFTLLLGANGSGKSTLMRTMYGSQPSLDGKIFIDKTDAEKITGNTKSRLISIVTSNAPIIGNITVFEMVAFGRYPYINAFGKIQDTDNDVIMKSLQQMGIEHLSNRLFSAISDGERQKTMIAKSLAQHTPYILMDEPMAFLDYRSRIEMMEMLVDMTHKHDKGILLSTHNLEMALQMADKLWVFDTNKQFCETTMQHLFESNMLGKLFDEKTVGYIERFYR